MNCSSSLELPVDGRFSMHQFQPFSILPIILRTIKLLMLFFGRT